MEGRGHLKGLTLVLALRMGGRRAQLGGRGEGKGKGGNSENDGNGGGRQGRGERISRGTSSICDESIR